VGLKLLQHFNIWWSLWERREVSSSWTYATFLIQLLPPLILYLQATALVTPTPQVVSSWREHYYAGRRRFFGLNLAFGLSNPLALYAAGIGIDGGQQLAPSLVIVAISLIGLLSSSHRVHSALAAAALLGNVLMITVLTLNPAESPFG